MLLKDKVVVITGGAGLNGLGFATARLMAAMAHASPCSTWSAPSPPRRPRNSAPDHLGIVADVTDKARAMPPPPRCCKAFGRIDALVNNAGITQPVKTLDITGADYDRILDVSLRGTLYMSQAVLPAMQKQESGSIVCISSVSAQRGGGILGGPHYSAAKAGVLGLARAMAREFGPAGIRINSITPGLIGTDIIKGKLTEEKKAEIAETIPLARLGRAEDIAGACVFLASDLSAVLHGHHARRQRRHVDPLSRSSRLHFYNPGDRHDRIPSSPLEFTRRSCWPRLRRSRCSRSSRAARTPPSSNSSTPPARTRPTRSTCAPRKRSTASARPPRAGSTSSSFRPTNSAATPTCWRRCAMARSSSSTCRR